jgi:hypothetical protein
MGGRKLSLDSEEGYETIPADDLGPPAHPSVPAAATAYEAIPSARDPPLLGRVGGAGLEASSSHRLDLRTGDKIIFVVIQRARMGGGRSGSAGPYLLYNG